MSYPRNGRCAREQRARVFLTTPATNLIAPAGCIWVNVDQVSTRSIWNCVRSSEVRKKNVRSRVYDNRHRRRANFFYQV